MLQRYLKVALHCTKPLPFIYFHGKNVSDQSSVKVLKPIEFLFLNKRWRCNEMLLFHLSLPFYLKNSNYGCGTGWFCTTPKYILTKFRDAKIDIFDIIEKKCDFVCFGNVSIRYNINDCVQITLLPLAG